MRPWQRAAKRADHSGLRRNTLALVHTELLVMHPSGISLNDHDAPHRTQTRKACCTCTCFHWIFACTKCARYLHSRLIVSSEFELPAIDSMWPTQLYRPSLPEKETSNAAPAFYRLRDVVRICAISRSTIYRRIAEGTFPQQIRLGQKLQRGPRKIWRNGSKIRRAIGYRDNTSERLRSRCGVSEGRLLRK